jgi:hypothetical protein
MEKIEIRYDKRKLLIGIVIMTALTIGCTYMAFFTKTFATNQIFKIVVVPLSIFVLYGVFTQLRKVLDNISIITLTATYIEINEDGQPQKFSWTEIKELTIEKKQTSKSEVDILTIKSDARTKEVNISTLDKSVDDIRGLIKNYRP